MNPRPPSSPPSDPPFPSTPRFPSRRPPGRWVAAGGGRRPGALDFSDAEIAMLDILARPELGRASRPDDLPLLDDVVRVGDARERVDLLVDEIGRAHV